MVELPCLLSSAEIFEGTTWHAALFMSMSFARCPARSLEMSSLTGTRSEARITDVLIHVGVGKLLGLDHHLQRIDGIVAVLSHGKVLHDVEHGESGDALAVGRKLVDGPAAVGGGDGLDPLGLEVAKVFQGMRAAVGVEELDHGLGHGAVVIGVAALCGDLAERVRQSRILEEIARLRSTRPDVVGFLLAGLIHEPLGDPVARIAFRQWKSILRVVNGRSEQLAEGQRAEARTHGIPSGDCAWDVDGLDADRIDFGDAFGFEGNRW